MPIITRKAPSWGVWLVAYSAQECRCSAHTAAQGGMRHHHCTARLWGPWAVASANQPAKSHQWVPIMARKAPSWGVRLVAYSAGERHCSDHKVGWRQSVCHRPSELVVTPLFDVSTKAATNVKGKTHASRIVSKTFFEVFRFIIATLDKFSQNAK